VHHSQRVRHSQLLTDRAFQLFRVIQISTFHHTTHRHTPPGHLHLVYQPFPLTRGHCRATIAFHFCYIFLIAVCRMKRAVSYFRSCYHISSSVNKAEHSLSQKIPKKPGLPGAHLVTTRRQPLREFPSLQRQTASR